MYLVFGWWSRRFRSVLGGGWFAVFSGVADKNASEPGNSLRASAVHREVSPSENWFSTDSQNPQAPLWLVNLWYIVLAAPTFAIWQ